MFIVRNVIASKIPIVDIMQKAAKIGRFSLDFTILVTV